MKKEIVDYENYLIYDDGNVFNTNTNKMLSGSIGQNGYKYYRLSKNNKKKIFYAHRLVAEAFLENKDNLPVVNHKDGNKLNNSVDNLEWCTAKENDIHARNTGLKLQNKPIKAINIDTEYSICFESLSECARYFSTNKGTIHRVLSGKRNKYKNFQFIYV